MTDAYNRSDDFIYASIILANNSTDVDSTMVASGSFNSGFPIIKDASEYICRVQRLYISEQQVPLLIPDIQLGQPNQNLTTYTFALSYNNGGTLVYSDPISVVYVPSSSVYPLPKQPIIAQDLSTSYYYVYYYQSFLDMWNTTMTSLLTNIQGKAGVPVGFTAGVSAKWYFDTNDGIKCDLTPDTKWNSPVNPAIAPSVSTLQLHFNAPLKKLVNGIRYRYNPNPTGCNYTFNIVPPLPIVPPSPYTITLSQQNIQELSYWASIRTIQIRSALLPSQYEISPSPVGIYGNQGTQSTNVVTDVQIDASESPVAYNTDVVYNNTDTLRVFNLTKKGTIQNIDAQVYWVDNYGRSFPLLLSYGISCEIKYEFVRKEVYYGMNKF